MLTPYQTYNNQIGVLLCFVVSNPELRHQDSLNIVTYDGYKQRALRANRKGVDIRLRKAGGHGNEALLAWEKIPSDWRELLVERFGDPKEKGPTGLMAYIEKDEKAAAFFSAYTFENDRYLPEEFQNHYTRNAEVLNGIRKLQTEQKAAHASAGKTLRNFWPTVSKAVNDIRTKFGHTLPTSQSQLTRVYISYNGNNYESLISKKFCNTNTQKITQEIEDWIVLEMAYTRQSIEMIYLKYQSIAASKGWRTDIEASAFRHRSSLPEIEQKINLKRLGAKSYRKLHGHTFKLKRALHSNDIWVGDGTAINWYYREGREVVLASTYMVMDSKSRKFLGWSTKKGMSGEGKDLQLQAYREALRTAQTKPYQVLFDNQSGQKTTEARDFFSKLAKVAFPTRPYRPSGKPIEQAFGDFQRLKLSEFPFWSGFGRDTHSDPRFKPDMDAIKKNIDLLPTFEQIVQLLDVVVNEWNDLDFNGQGSPNQIYAANKNPEEQTIELHDYMELFYNIQGPKKYSQTGIKLNLKGEEFQYEVYTPEGDVDFKFRQRYLGQKMYIKYDPEREFLGVELLVIHPTGGWQKIAEAQPMREVNRAVNRLEPGEREWIDKQMKLETDHIAEIESELVEIGYSEAEKWTNWASRLEKKESKMQEDSDNDDSYADLLSKM